MGATVVATRGAPVDAGGDGVAAVDDGSGLLRNRFRRYELARRRRDRAELLWRIGVSFRLPVGEVLADGTYLSALTAPRVLRWAGATDITVRVVEYRFDDEAG